MFERKTQSENHIPKTLPRNSRGVAVGDFDPVGGDRVNMVL